MFAKVLCFVAFAGLVGAKVPSYIHVCGARNPNLDMCILESVQALIPNVRDGIPELDVPTVEPLIIDHIDLLNTPSFIARATNIKLWGLSNFIAKALHIDLETKVIDLHLHFDQLRLESLYNVTAKILVELKGRGPIKINASDIDAKARMLYKLVERDGKKYVFFYSMKTHLIIGDYSAQFTTQGFDKTVQEAINEALNHSRNEITELTRPNLEKVISEKCLEISNKICKHFSYDELFPDRE